MPSGIMSLSTTTNTAVRSFPDPNDKLHFKWDSIPMRAPSETTILHNAISSTQITTGNSHKWIGGKTGAARGEITRALGKATFTHMALLSSRANRDYLVSDLRLDGLLPRLQTRPADVNRITSL